MTSLTTALLRLPMADCGPPSTLPPIDGRADLHQIQDIRLDEHDGLFVGYGFVSAAYPYRTQDQYTRSLHPGALQTAVLENDHLRAVFVPSLGGRLWSLVDKRAGRELLFANPVLRLANLATCNAWFSGGVEWNCGIVGHHPYTCSPLFCASLTGVDGAPILRLYEYERIRGVTIQMDFHLPEDSRFLLCRMRLVNASMETVPMYWWSNIAVPALPGARVVTDAVEAFTHAGDAVYKVPVPLTGGVDVTYPERNPISVDYFWNVPPGSRKYIGQLDAEGYGLIQASTARLKGRKLFVWGNTRGGDHWQEFLSGGGCAGRYNEIQAGLAQTQYECLPMPPKTAWEWMEAYGPMQADPGRIHGGWDEARAEAERTLERLLPAEALERRLEESRGDALRPADKILFAGSGWGALENERRQSAGLPVMEPHLDFGAPGDLQRPWRQLLTRGSLPLPDDGAAPDSWMASSAWTALLETAAAGPDRDNWHTHLQLGCAYISAGRYAEGRPALETSLALKQNPCALYALAMLALRDKDAKTAAALAVDAAALCPEDPSFATAAMRLLFQAGRYAAIADFTSRLAEPLRGLPRIRLYRAYAALRLGDVDTAETLLRAGDGWLEIPDIREGEVCLSELWYELEERKAARDGVPFDRAAVAPPYALDFRMDA